MKRDPECTRCGLCSTAQFVCLLGQGPTPSDVVILGDAPGEREDDSGLPFVGRTGNLLERCLAKAGVSRDSVYITNAVHCRPPDNRTPRATEVRACSYWLRYEFHHVKPKFVLLLGATAFFSIFGLKGLKKYRGAVLEKNGITYKVTYHPSYVLRNPKAEPVLEEDIRQFFKLINQAKAEVVKYSLITPLNLDRVIKWISNRKEICLDCETSGLDPFDPASKIISIGLSDGKVNKILVLNHRDKSLDSITQLIMVKRLGKVLSKVKLIGHNIKFDCTFIAKKYGVKLYGGFDTMLAFHIIDENRSLQLKNILSRVFPEFVDYDILTEEKQGLGDLNRHCQYLAKDVYYTFKLKQHIEANEFDERLERLHSQLVMPANEMYTKSELNGVYFDRKNYAKAKKYWIGKRDVALQLMNGFLADHPPINWDSPKQLGELMFKHLKLPIVEVTSKGAPSTKESVLLNLAETEELPKHIIEYRGAVKNLQFLASWREKTDRNGFFHPKFKIAGTVTGRPSCEDPNLQQTPREATMRCCIGAPPGYVLVEVDYSQVELRLVADKAEDLRMIYCFNNSIDIHTWVAMNIMGISNPTKDERKKAKAVDFGFIYGMSADHFQEYAFEKYGLRMTLEECTERRNQFFSTFKQLKVWHKKQKDAANELGYVSTWTGRRRHLPHAHRYKLGNYTYEVGEALRQAINSPIQGGAAELLIASGIEIMRKYPRDVKIIGTIHDALLFYVKEKDVDRLLPEIYDIMIKPKLLKVFEKQFCVPLDVEIKVGNWGAGVEWKRKA